MAGWDVERHVERRTDFDDRQPRAERGRHAGRWGAGLSTFLPRQARLQPGADCADAQAGRSAIFVQ